MGLNFSQQGLTTPGNISNVQIDQRVVNGTLLEQVLDCFRVKGQRN